MSKSKPEPLFTFHTKIVSVTKKNNDGKDRQKIIRKHIRQGTELLLSHEKDNKYDKNAVSVWYQQKKFLGKKLHKLGYLPRGRAEDIADMLDELYRYSVVVKEVTGGTRQKKTRGINLHIEMHEPEE